MNSLSAALYCRTSSDEQAERHTIDNQREFLHAFTRLYDMPVAEVYADDGVSGALALGARPAGQRLLADAHARRFALVLVYRIDRLGRSLTALLDAHQVLSQEQVTIRSATEPFDTATPIGTFLFQLLGSMAELERATIQDRMTLGKARVARLGKWVGGPIPFGYDLSEAGALVPSALPVEPLGCTEADLARDLFTRIAQGSTTVTECRRLNALGIVPVRRYRGREATRHAALWETSRLGKMLHSTTYKGEHVFQSRHGAVVRAVPALITPEVWQAVQTQLRHNRTLPKGNATRLYLLRGLLRCTLCGSAYVGTSQHVHGRTRSYYRCGSWRWKVRGRAPSPRCPGKMLRAEPLEQWAWAECRAGLLTPGATDLLRITTADDRPQDDLLPRLDAALRTKQQERARAITLARRGLMTGEELEAQLATITQETAVLVQECAAVRDALCRAQAEPMTRLARLQERLAQIERTDDQEMKRDLLVLLIAEIPVATHGTGQRKTATVLPIRYRCEETSA
jgi:site-specific DNA recombinase